MHQLKIRVRAQAPACKVHLHKQVVDLRYAEEEQLHARVPPYGGGLAGRVELSDPQVPPDHPLDKAVRVARQHGYQLITVQDTCAELVRVEHQPESGNGREVHWIMRLDLPRRFARSLP